MPPPIAVKRGWCASVRSLAQRASSAAKEIKELIHRSVSTIHEGSSQAAEVGRTMDEVQ